MLELDSLAYHLQTKEVMVRRFASNLEKEASMLLTHGTTWKSDDIRFVVEDKAVTREVASKAPILVAGNMLPAGQTVFGFEDEKSFFSWAERMPIGEKMLKIHRRFEAAKALEKTDLESAKSTLRRRTDRIVSELLELAERTSLPVTSGELFLRATDADCHPIEGPIFDPSIIYEHINFKGAWRPITAAIPDFRWIGFNDKASSVRVSGAGVLFEHIWFKGRRFYFGGIPYMDFPDLRQFAFNDLASSAVLS